MSRPSHIPTLAVLERLYPDTFRHQRQPERDLEQPKVTVKPKQTIAGYPEEALEAARADLQRRIRENDWEYPEAQNS